MGRVATFLVFQARRPPWYDAPGRPVRLKSRKGFSSCVMDQYRYLLPVKYTLMCLIEINLASASTAVTLNRPHHKVALGTRASKASGLVAAAFLRSDKEHNVGDGGDFGQAVRVVAEGINDILDVRRSLWVHGQVVRVP